jgi:hypothetical protein
MSPRPMSSEMQQAVTSVTGESVHLIEFEFSTGVLRMSTGAVDLDWASDTWRAVGGLLQFGGVHESADASDQSVEIRLSGVNQTVVAALLSSNWRGRSVTIWKAFFDPETGAIISTPLRLFRGKQLTQYVVQETRADHDRPGTVEITTRVMTELGIDNRRGIISNVATHQRYYPGDTFFQTAVSMANTKIYWGTPIPIGVGSSSWAGGQGGPSGGTGGIGLK